MRVLVLSSITAAFLLLVGCSNSQFNANEVQWNTSDRYTSTLISSDFGIASGFGNIGFVSDQYRSGIQFPLPQDGFIHSIDAHLTAITFLANGRPRARLLSDHHTYGYNQIGHKTRFSKLQRYDDEKKSWVLAYDYNDPESWDFPSHLLFKTLSISTHTFPTHPYTIEFNDENGSSINSKTQLNFLFESVDYIRLHADVKIKATLPPNYGHSLMKAYQLCASSVDELENCQKITYLQGLFMSPNERIGTVEVIP